MNTEAAEIERESEKTNTKSPLTSAHPSSFRHARSFLPSSLPRLALRNLDDDDFGGLSQSKTHSSIQIKLFSIGRSEQQDKSGNSSGPSSLPSSMSNVSSPGRKMFKLNAGSGGSGLKNKMMKMKSAGQDGEHVEETFDNLFERAGLGSDDETITKDDDGASDIASTDVSSSEGQDIKEIGDNDDSDDDESETESQKMRRILYGDTSPDGHDGSGDGNNGSKQGSVEIYHDTEHGAGNGGDDGHDSDDSSNTSYSRSQSTRGPVKDGSSSHSDASSQSSRQSGRSGDGSEKDDESGSPNSSSKSNSSGDGSEKDGSSSSHSGSKSYSDNKSGRGGDGSEKDDESGSPDSSSESNSIGDDSEKDGSSSSHSGSKSQSENKCGQQSPPSSGSSSNENGSDSYEPGGSSSESSSERDSGASKEKSDLQLSRSDYGSRGSSASDKSNSYRPGYKSDDGRSAFSGSDSSESSHSSQNKKSSDSVESRKSASSKASENSRLSLKVPRTGATQMETPSPDGDAVSETERGNSNVVGNVKRQDHESFSTENSSKSHLSRNETKSPPMMEHGEGGALPPHSSSPTLSNTLESESSKKLNINKKNELSRKDPSSHSEATPPNVAIDLVEPGIISHLEIASSPKVDELRSMQIISSLKSPIVVLRQLTEMTIKSPPIAPKLLDEEEPTKADESDASAKVEKPGKPQPEPSKNRDHVNGIIDEETLQDDLSNPQTQLPFFDQANGVPKTVLKSSAVQPETTLWPDGGDEKKTDGVRVYSSEEIGWKPPTLFALATFGETMVQPLEKKQDPDDYLNSAPKVGSSEISPMVAIAKNVEDASPKRSKKRIVEDHSPPVSEVTVVPPPDDESTLGTEGVYLERFPPKTNKSVHLASEMKLSNIQTNWTLPSPKKEFFTNSQEQLQTVSEIETTDLDTNWVMPYHKQEGSSRRISLHPVSEMKTSNVQTTSTRPSPKKTTFSKADPPGERDPFPSNPKKQTIASNHPDGCSSLNYNAPEQKLKNISANVSASKNNVNGGEHKLISPGSNSWIPSEKQMQAYQEDKKAVNIYYKPENYDDADSIWAPPGVARSRSTEDVEIESRRAYIDAIMYKKRANGQHREYVDTRQQPPQVGKPTVARVDFSGTVSSSSSSSSPSRPSSRSRPSTSSQEGSFVEIDYSESTKTESNQVFRPDIIKFPEGSGNIPKDESFVEIDYSNSSSRKDNSSSRKERPFVERDYSNSSSRTSEHSAFVSKPRQEGGPRVPNWPRANEQDQLQFQGVALAPLSPIGEHKMVSTPCDYNQGMRPVSIQQGQQHTAPYPSSAGQSGPHKSNVGPNPNKVSFSPPAEDSESSSSSSSVRKDNERRTTLIMLTVIALFVLIAGGAVTATILILNRESEENSSPTFSPAFPPISQPSSSNVPTPSPTTSANTPTTGTPTVPPTPTVATSPPFGTPTNGENLNDLIVRAYPPGAEALQDPLSPQSIALRWLESSANSAVTTEESYLQRYALATLYFATDGSEWTDNTSWLTNTNECSWRSTKPTSIGICDPLGRYVELHLESNNLRGSTLPPELVLLSDSLKVINLLGNSISGTVPTFIVDMKALEVFDMSSNQLGGTIPEVLSNATTLKQLSFYDNSLFSTIPSSFGSLDRLEVLDLGLNELSGTIPSSFGKLSRLAGLSVVGNFLTGTVPTELSNLVALEMLYIDSNDLIAPVSDGICALNLVEFWSDCEEIQCLCCTMCCSDGFGCFEA